MRLNKKHLVQWLVSGKYETKIVFSYRLSFFKFLCFLL